MPGVTYSRRNEVIVPDLAASSTGSLFEVGGRVEARPEDGERYKSAAAVPVLAEPDAAPWGVVVATSGQRGHFHSNAETGIHAAEAVRALAGMISLALRAVQAKHAGEAGDAGRGR